MKITDGEISECAGCTLAGVRKARHDGRLRNLEDLVVFCLSGRLKKLGIEFLDGFGNEPLEELHYTPDDEHRGEIR